MAYKIREDFARMINVFDVRPEVGYAIFFSKIPKFLSLISMVIVAACQIVNPEQTVMLEPQIAAR